MNRLTTGWLVSLGLGLSLGGCMFGSKQTTYVVDGLAQFTLPADWRVGGAEPHGRWSAVPLRKSQGFHFGAGDPLEVEGWAVLGAANASPEDLELGMKFAFAAVQARTSRFPEFGDIKTAARTTWISEGNYQIGSQHDPEKVLFLRSLNPDTRSALVLRVYLRKIKHEKLREIEHEFFATLKYSDGRARHFATLPTSAKAKQQRESEIERINSVLATHGLPPMPLQAIAPVEAHDGWIYQIRDHHFVIARRLGDQPKAEAVARGRGRGDVVWLEYEAGEWRSGAPQVKTRPAEGQHYRESQPVPWEWHRALALDADRTRSYFFHVLSCPLTEFESEVMADPSTWGLEAWFERALAVEAGFRGGRLQ